MRGSVTKAPALNLPVDKVSLVEVHTRAAVDEHVQPETLVSLELVAAARIVGEVVSHPTVHLARHAVGLAVRYRREQSFAWCHVGPYSRGSTAAVLQRFPCVSALRRKVALRKISVSTVNAQALAENEMILEEARALPVAGRYDVLVCGGGTSGVPAAIAAARAGAKTALVERYGFLGGVPAYCIMPAWHRLGEGHSRLLAEFAERVRDVGKGPNPLVTQHMEPECVKMAALNMACEAGVDIHLHSLICDTTVEGDRVTGVVTESKSGRRVFLGDVVVDATGDADVAAGGGARFMLGDELGVTQGMTVRFRIGYINFDRYFDWISRNRHYFRDIDDQCISHLRRKAADGETFYMAADLSPLYRKHPEYPDLPHLSYFNGSSLRRNELSLNATRVHGLDGTSEEDLTKAEIECRKQAFAVWRFLRDNVPGFEDSTIVETAPQVGVRETRRIIGDYLLTENDCRRGAEFEDTIARNPISFDLHDKTYSLESLPHSANIPYRCLLPVGLESILVVGRCISTDHVANSSVRRMMTAFELGQVGGVAAALAAGRGVSPRGLPFAVLRVAMTDAGILTDSDGR